MANNRQVSDLLKQLGEDWEKVVWNEAYEANIIMDRAEGETGQSCAVDKPDKEHAQARMEIRTIDMENHEEWMLVQNDLYQSNDSSAITLCKDSSMCEFSCALSKLSDEEYFQDWSIWEKHQNNDLAMRKEDMSTNNSLQLRFNSLQEDYLYFLQNVNSKPAEVHRPTSPNNLLRDSDSGTESNHSKKTWIDSEVNDLEAEIGQPPHVPFTKGRSPGSCGLTGGVLEVEESNHQAHLRIEEEDRSLKKLLRDIVIRNKLQASTIHNVNHRLDELERKLRSRRNSGEDHHAQHSSRVSSKPRTPPRSERPLNTAIVKRHSD